MSILQRSQVLPAPFWKILFFRKLMIVKKMDFHQNLEAYSYFLTDALIWVAASLKTRCDNAELTGERRNQSTKVRRTTSGGNLNSEVYMAFENVNFA